LLLVTPRNWTELVPWARGEGHTQSWLRHMLAWMELHAWIEFDHAEGKWRGK
jgi:hypothetical protein